MQTSDYLDRLRRLIAEAPDGFDVASLQSALAAAEAHAGIPLPDHVGRGVRTLR